MKTKATGVEYWRSLEHLAESPEVREMMAKEFQSYEPEQLLSDNGPTRRAFMKVMAASMALAGVGLTGCRRWPKEEIVPFSSNLKNYAPGEPWFYATTSELGGVGSGLLVTSYDGRPIKIEGNPLHPFNKITDRYGSADVFAQAATLELYDPERSRTPIDRSSGRPRASSLDAVKGALPTYFTGSGADIAVLSEVSLGPSAQAQKARFLAKFPAAKWYEYEAINRDNELAGTKLAFGQALRPYPHLDKAAVIVSLDEDFFARHPAKTRLSADWSETRRSVDAGKMSRFYVAESAFTITGAKADVRLPVKASEIELLVRAIAAGMGVPGVTAAVGGESAAFVEAVVADLKANLGKSALLAGAHLSPEAHALVAAVNVAVGGGQVTTFHAVPGTDGPSSLDSVKAAAADLSSGRVKTLLILGGNPVYDAPFDLGFTKLIQGTPDTIHLSLYDNETSRLCKWHVNRAQWLEAWGDTRAWDGTVAVAQPLIQPLFGGVSTIEFLALLTGDDKLAGQDIVRRSLKLEGTGNEAAWRQVLNDGVVASSASANAGATPRPFKAGIESVPTGSEFEIRFVSDFKLYDGRYANSGWLQELPDTMTKTVWDTCALISLADAKKLGVGKTDVLKLTVNGQALDVPAYLMPGQPNGSITVSLGYGRTAAGNVGGDTDRNTPSVGANTYLLRSSAGMAVAPVYVERSSKTYNLVATVDHFLIDDVGFKGRDERVGDKKANGMIVRETSFDEYKQALDKGKPRKLFSEGHHNLNLQLFNPPSEFNEPHAWAMSIDMTACVGCAACVVACQSENNIPVVGKKEVDSNREMHWIRIDRYFRTKGETVEERKSDPNPEVVFQPMMCVHCENAPCEQVCPVAATMHDTEGLNVMVYNRCIGTRYCSNNCPYKVRRFNYYDWHSLYHQNGSTQPRFPLPWLDFPDTQQNKQQNPILEMVQNPEVTVRMRGVMEKCTYCVQRIHTTTQHARRDHAQGTRESPLVQDGEVLTACQQACPTQAIIFGNLNDPNAKVTKLHQNPRAFAVLEELNTRPRGKHLAIVRNGPAEPTKPEAAPAEHA